MLITPLRSNSPGIKGTYQNLYHHAQPLEELIKFLESIIPTLPFHAWKQGNNVHLLITEDDRTLVFRPARDDRGYFGVTVATRFSRSSEMHLFTLFADKKDKSGYPWWSAMEFLYQFAQPQVKAWNENKD